MSSCTPGRSRPSARRSRRRPRAACRSSRPAAGGPLDLVADGVTGYLVPPGDPGALTAAVGELAADPAAAGAVQRGGAAAGARPHLVRADRRAARPLRRRAQRRRAGRAAGSLSRDGAGGMTRIVTLGDSITLGMGDPAPGGGWRGWAQLPGGGPARPGAAQPRGARRAGQAGRARPAAGRAGAAAATSPASSSASTTRCGPASTRCGPARPPRGRSPR